MKKGLISLLFLLSCGVWDAAAQDLIVKKDGTNVEAKVLEIGEKDIKYKKASHLDGPTYLVSVANVVYIRFEDGSTDIFFAHKGFRFSQSNMQVSCLFP